MMANFKLIIEYDGTNYHGWQYQKNARTIQEEIEKGLTLMTGQNIRLIGSGRTDAGVHALAQVANFHCETKLTPEIFQKGLNSILDDDIVIKACSLATEEFHARFDVMSKTYHYRILNRSVPAAINRQYAWFIRKELDTDAMRAAIQHIIGTHDFKAFEGSGSPRKHTIRTVFNANLTEQDDGYLLFEIEANGFLKFMVRNITGSLVSVGHNKITPEEFKQILFSKDRNQAGPTAPARGLFLAKVIYREDSR